MPRSSQYTHFMQRIDIDGQNAFDIEETYDGLLYEKAEGINTIGKPKNVYTEQYADSDRVRYYLPDDDNYTNENTKITMTFIVVGTPEKRQQVIDDFLSEVRKGVHKYWDTARNREFSFIVTEEITISNEQWYGNQPFVELSIPMTNLNGKTAPYRT